MPSRDVGRRGLLAVGLLLVVLLGMIDVLVRGEDSALAAVWEQIVPREDPIQRTLRRLPGR